MANRYWNPSGAANWSSTSAWALTDGGTPDQAAPTASDDVFFTSTNSQNCTLSSTSVAKSVSFTGGTGYAGTFGGSSQLTISGDLTLASTMTFSATGAIVFNASANITTNTKAMTCPITVNGTSITVTLMDDLVTGTSRAVTLTSGSLDCNNNDLTCGAVSASASTAGTLTYDSSTITAYSAFVFTGTSLSLVDDASSSLVITNGTATCFQSKALTYNNLSITSASSSSVATLSGNLTIEGNFTVGGTAVNRTWFNSSVNGTQRTITCNGTVSLAYCDFQDIVGAGSGTWSGTSIGNAGNNSGITFTTPTTCTWIGGTGTFGTGAEWDTGVAPLCHDSAVFNAGSFSADGQVVTFSGKLLPACDFSAIDQAVTFTFSNSPYIVGSLISDTSLTINNNADIYFINRSDINFDPQSTINIDLIDIRSVGAKVTLLSNLAMSGGENNILKLSNGTFDTGGYDVTCKKIQSNTNFARTLTLNDSTITLTGTGTGTSSVLYKDWDHTNLTTTANTAQILFTATGAAVGVLWYSTDYWYSMTYSGNNTFSTSYDLYATTFTMDSTGGANTLTITAGKTLYTTSLVCSGTAGKIITINSSTTTNATISDSAGTNNLTYVAIDNVNATGGAVFNVDVNSTVGADSTGWTTGRVYTFNKVGYTWNEVTYTLND